MPADHEQWKHITYAWFDNEEMKTNPRERFKYIASYEQDFLKTSTMLDTHLAYYHYVILERLASSTKLLDNILD